MNQQAQALLNRTKFLDDARVAQALLITAIQDFNATLGGEFGAAEIGYKTRTVLDRLNDTANPKDYGAIADGTSHPLSEFFATLAEAQAVYPHAIALTDEIDWAATQAASNAGTSRIHVPGGDYIFNRQVTRTTDLVLSGDGYSSHLDFSAFNSSDGFLISGAITQINDLAVNVAKGARSLSFSGTPSLVTGDVVCVYNPTNGTWLSDRTVYRAGEYFRVHTLASDIATVYGESTDAYLAADVDVYRLDGVRVVIENIRATPASTSQYAPIKVLHGNGVRVRNYWGSPNGTYTGLSVERSYDIDFCGVTSINASESINNEYGFVMANCQNVTATGGSTVATRHAISIGGTDAPCCVPNRNVLIHGMTLENIDLAADIGAGDMHGNCDNVIYDNCIFRNGAIMQGRNVTIRNSLIYGVSSTDGVCIYGTEVKGGVFTIENNRFITNGDAAAVGSVHISPSTSQTERLTIMARNNTFEIPNAAFNSKPFFIRGRGVTFPINIIVDGMHLIAPIAVFAFVYADDNVLAALNSEMIVVDNVTGPAGTPLLYPAGDIAAVPTRQMRQSSGVDIVSTASTLNAAPAQTFRYPYSKIPTFAGVSVGGVAGASFSTLGGQVPVPLVRQLTATAITPAVQASAAFTAGSGARLTWEAGIAEV